VLKTDKNHAETEDTGIKCPHCGCGTVKKYGRSKSGKQRFLCCNEKCRHKTFVDHYTYNAYDPNIRSRILFSIINGSGTRAAAKTLGIAEDTVANALKSIEVSLWYVNYDYLKSRQNGGIVLDFVPVNEAEMEEMWSFIGDKTHRYRLWWAIDRNTGEPLAFHFGTGEYENPDGLLALLRPFDINIAYSGHNFAGQSRVTGGEPGAGKEKHPKPERKYLPLRTWCSRLVRKGIGFSKDCGVQKIVALLVINFWFFQRILW
jgi:insertion element IS1 protein InsB